MSKDNPDTKYENVHWADNSAKRVLEEFPNEEVYTVASGITPSGIIHFGHFREILTSELVRRALERKGKKTHFIYSWDSYDAFRKVPKNVPESWKEYLRLPVAKVPHPNDTQNSYGEHYMKDAEEVMGNFHFPIEYQWQHKLQTSGIYAEGIKNHLNKLKEIKELINSFRSEDRKLTDDWFPIELYSEKTGKDEVEILDYDGNYSITYRCLETGFENTIDFRKTPIVKLRWRLDWPMRWNHFKVTFEPGGKDHSTPGGSYDTGKDIIQIVSNRKAPVYTFYNFVGMKGFGGKISSSTGTGATLRDGLEIYTPDLILYMFASTRPNAEMTLSFDADVIKIYEDFDKLERLYYGLEEESNPKKLETLKRTYELSQVDYGEGLEPQKEIPFQPSFRHLTTVVQANNFDEKKVLDYYNEFLKTDFDKRRIIQRMKCAENWLKNFAPEEMRFSINNSLTEDFIDNLTNQEKEIVKEVRDILMKINDPQTLFGEFKKIIESQNYNTQSFFKLMYKIVINKEKGPKLAGFMIDNKSKVIALLNQI